MSRRIGALDVQRVLCLWFVVLLFACMVGTWMHQHMVYDRAADLGREDAEKRAAAEEYYRQRSLEWTTMPATQAAP